MPAALASQRLAFESMWLSTGNTAGKRQNSYIKGQQSQHKDTLTTIRKHLTMYIFITSH